VDVTDLVRVNHHLGINRLI